MFIKGKKGPQIRKCEKKLVKPFNLEDRTIFEPLPAFPKKGSQIGKTEKSLVFGEFAWPGFDFFLRFCKSGALFM